MLTGSLSVALGNVEAGSVAALLGTRFSVVSGGLASILGALALAFAIPALARYDSRSSSEVVDVVGGGR